jgi:hypothetical protein
MTRILIALMGLTLLSACNALVTEKPLFTAADEAGAPAMKPGVWLMFEQPGCTVDVKRPIDEWSDCAGGAVYHPGEMVGHDSKAPKGVWEHAPFVLAAGDPRIAQVRIKIQVASGGSQQSNQPYGYGAARPTKLDPQGRIVAMTYWFVDCGPPPPKDKDGNDTAAGTLKPLPGLVMKPGDPTCTTTSKDAVRGAAKASEAWKTAPLEARWLRDGEK